MNDKTKIPEGIETAWTHSPELIEAGRKLFAKPCGFTYAVDSLDRLPEPEMVEIGFIGRSNVGKSSLVNSLTGQKTLARTSNTPGRTQQLNFFNLGDTCYLVDMPGYGYAKVSKSLKKSWDYVCQSYLRGRINLRLVCVLVDARHPFKQNDIDIMKMLDQNAVPYVVVLTKGDKIKEGGRKGLLNRAREVLVKHPAADPEPILTSSVNQMGVEALRARLAKLVLDFS